MKTMIMSSSAIPVTPEVREQLRPIGRNNEQFRKAFQGYEQLAIWADELGFDAFCSTEHHFQIEGGESIPNNLLLYAKLAALTKKITFVPGSVVVTSHDPIRVAEDLALFTHMFPGRLGVAFARGFMTRWFQTLAQGENVTSHGPGDAANRRRFDEYLDVIDKAWSEDSFNHNGEFYQAPYPAIGIRNWPLAKWTRQYGAPGDVDDEGTIHKIGVVPKPFARPEIFVPFTVAEQTITDSARRGRTLMVAAAGSERILKIAKQYQDAAREAGRDLALGQGVGVVAKVVLGETFEEAFELAVETSGFWYQNVFRNFYFNEGYRRPSDPPQRPLDLGDARALTQRMFEAGQLICGTVDQVLEKAKSLAGLYGEGQLDWLFWEYWAQVVAHDWEPIQRYQLETFAKRVMPELSSATR